MFLTSDRSRRRKWSGRCRRATWTRFKGRAQIGKANVHDQQNAELDADDKHAAYFDAEFELSRAELQLLRLTGELENWAIPSP